MSKNYLLFKSYLLALTLLFTTTIIIYSCRKDRGSSINRNSKEIIAEAKSYFEEEILSKSLLIPDDPNFRHSLIKRPVWEKAVIKKISLGDAVIVPIQFAGNILTKPTNGSYKSYLNKTSYLMLYQDKKQKMHVEWITLLPTDIEKPGAKSFKGVAVVEDWSGKFNRAFAFNDSLEYTSVYLKQAVTYNYESYKRSDYCITIEHWGSVGVDGYMSPRFFGAETYCFGEGGSGTGSDGGGGYHPIDEEQVDPGEYPTYYIDCNWDINGSAFIDPNCGCIGGNTGLTECKRDIIDSVKNACIKAQLAKALSANTSIKNMLNETFGGTIQYESLNISFIDVTTLPADVDGQQKRGSTTSTEFTIELNKNTLPNSSQEYTLATVYHEILHAYLEGHFNKDGNETYIIPDHHEEMANKYVFLMTGALRVAFPSLSTEEAWALSWGGLQKTTLYTSNLTANQRTQIVDINNRHKSKTAVNKLGTYCTP
ncbi:hypothetical protein [uncultured Pedobacter sp.]|uniref:hypothetical protein n=1 Tax=uncultured Pedobacter sp. TaxID=246139 RepID=UPI0025D27AF3|nr:hypothetical protein [uncultured Pedobacter sp.]